MRDTYQNQSAVRVSGSKMVQTPSGLRHSVRPRRLVMEREEQRALANGISAEVAQRPTPDEGAPHWQDLSLEPAGERRAISSAMPVADADRDNPAVRAFDLLRTRLRQVTQENGWRNIAITAPTSGCGTTFTSVNLALSLSRVRGSRTVLMDMNLRNPGVAQAFDMKARGMQRYYLDGTVPMGRHLVRASNTLALGLSEGRDDSPSETLQDPNTGLTLDKMRAALRPELMLYDMPAMLEHDDVSAFLPQLDGILLVSDGTKSMSRQLTECERMLDGKVPLLGVVLNKARRN